jgi:hypothetical protein
MCMQESIGESASPYEAAVFVLSVWMIVPIVLVVLAGYSVSADNHPTDDELVARFLSHEADFQVLVKMLDTDRRRLPLRPEPFDLADLVAAGVGAARRGDYESLLAKIDLGSFRYFAQSGNVALPVSESGGRLPRSIKSYLYLSSDDPQRLLHHRSYAWHGPGVYPVTGDYRIKGRWFIHREGIVVVAFAPH